MKRLNKFKPAFWDHRDITADRPLSGISFARKWKIIVGFTSFMALLPLAVMTFMEVSLTRQIVQDEIRDSMDLLTASAAISLESAPETAVTAYLAKIDLKSGGDLFAINMAGKPVTPSRYFKGADSLPAGIYTASNKGSATVTTPDKKIYLVSHARIPDSDLTLVYARSRDQITRQYFAPRLKLAGYLVVSIVLIVLSIMGLATFLVGKIHAADKRRTQALHRAENENKLASIGRLASGVAHEINNPLAIINQKTGLILDLLELKEKRPADDRLVTLSHDVLNAVKRCGSITRQMLDFARHMEPCVQPVDLYEIIDMVLSFLKPEAQKKQLIISVENIGTVQGLVCDRGSLQQIFLNLFDNAFAAMEDGGQLTIGIQVKKRQQVWVVISDTGVGIPEEDLPNIFEPFYSSKNEHWGTGLGLSITYGLIKKMGADILVTSTVGKGTRFTLILPLTQHKDQTCAPENPTAPVLNPIPEPNPKG